MIREEDERAIEDLFERLRRVERQSGPRDRDSEALIRQRLAEHPAAAYYMAQAIIVQEAALRDQQARIESLEADRSRSGGFLGSIFGDDAERRTRPEQVRRPGPWDRTDGGGFLAGAAQTALGVTGGVLLGSAIAGMFSEPAQAAETQAAPEEPSVEEDIDAGDDWGGFDIGGEF